MRRILIVFTLLVVFSLQFLRQVFFMEFHSVIYLVMYLFLFMVINKKGILPLYLYLIFISSGIELYVLNIIFVVVLLYKYRASIEFNRLIYIYIALLLFEAIHLLININDGHDGSIVYFMGFALCFIPFFFIGGILKSISIKLSFHAFVAGFFSFVIILISTYAINYGMSEYFAVIQRFGFLPGTSFSPNNMIEMNPNTIGKYAALIITTALILINKKLIKFNFFNIIVIFATFIIGLFTLSRAFLLTILIVLILMFTLKIRISLKQFYLTMISILTIIIMNIIVIIINPQIYNLLYERIFETEDISGQRFTIYLDYLHVIFSNLDVLLFGVGMQDYIDILVAYGLVVTQSTHNFIIEVLVIWGVSGLFLVSLMFYKL